MSQTTPDTTFIPDIKEPHFSEFEGPVILIDETHNNLHTLEAGYLPFANLAQMDGYRVKAYTGSEILNPSNILVVVNAINENNIGNWQRPIYPAFTQEEVDQIKEFVNDGGSLLLIADHMPFAGAANILANTFGFDFCDGFAELAEKTKNNDVFSISNNRLVESSFLKDEMGQPLKSVTSFMGSAFSIPEGAHGIMKFQKEDLCLIPEIAWQFEKDTPNENLNNKYQGALLKYGKGKVAVFGEAAMFTAQLVTQNENTFKIGFNSYFAPNNVNFIRSVLMWLSNADQKNTESILQQEILAVNKQMETSFNNKKFTQVGDFYVKDAVMVGGNNTEVIGQEKIKPYFGLFQNATKWELENIEIKPLGDKHALQRGYSNIYFNKPDGTEGLSRSIFSLIWEKKDGEWKILLDHFSGR